MDIIYHGKSHDIFFKGKVYNRRQKLSTVNLTAAEYEALEYPDSLTLYTVTYPDDSIKKFIGDMEVDIIQEEFCTPQEYAALNPPDPYTLYTVIGNGVTKKYLGKREIGTQNFEEIYLTQNEYDSLGESINLHALYHITDITGKSYFGKNLLIKEVELTSSEYEQLVEDDEVDQYTLYTLSDNGKQYLGSLELGASAVLTSKNINENGTYLASEDNADGYDSVTVDIPSSTLITKSINTNGTYLASDDNADGYSEVAVNIAGQTPIEIGAVRTVGSNHYSLILTKNTNEDLELNMNKDYEIVCCIRTGNISGRQYKIAMYAAENHPNAGFSLVIDKDNGIAFGQFFYGNRTINDVYELSASGLILDDRALNFIKVKRTGQILTIELSSDGVHYQIKNQMTIPDGTTFMSNYIPTFGLKGDDNDSVADYALSFRAIQIANCYIKQENTVIWGREVNALPLVTKSIISNGTYLASQDNASGYDVVTVQISMVSEGNLFDFTSKRESNGYRNHAAFAPYEGDPQTYETDMSSYAPCCYISEYIPVIENTKYFLVRPEFMWNGCGTVIYDSNKQRLSYVASDKQSYQEITMPANAAFVRLSIVDTTGISLTTCPDFERLCSFCQA